MKLNLSFNVTRLIRDIAKGKPVKPTSYVWVTASKQVSKPKKK